MVFWGGGGAEAVKAILKGSAIKAHLIFIHYKLIP